MNVRYHSGPKRIDRFIVKNAFKIIDRSDAVGVMADQRVLVEIAGQGKCLMQNAPTVEMNVRYHSGPKRIDRFIVKNAFKITGITSRLYQVLYTLKHIKIKVE